MTNEVIEVFGEYAVQIDDRVELFVSRQEAQIALSVFNNGAGNLKLAKKYCEYLGLDPYSKNAVGKVNVITAFLSYCDAGEPGADPVPELEPIEYTTTEEEIVF